MKRLEYYVNYILWFKKLKENNQFVISSFLRKLLNYEENRLIIKDFLLKQEYINFFMRNGKVIRKILYLNCEGYNCTIRGKELGKKKKNYVGCSSLRNENAGFDKKPKYMNFF